MAQPNSPVRLTPSSVSGLRRSTELSIQDGKHSLCVFKSNLQRQDFVLDLNAIIPILNSAIANKIQLEAKDSFTIRDYCQIVDKIPAEAGIDQFLQFLALLYEFATEELKVQIVNAIKSDYYVGVTHTYSFFGDNNTVAFNFNFVLQCLDNISPELKVILGKSFLGLWFENQYTSDLKQILEPESTPENNVISIKVGELSSSDETKNFLLEEIENIKSFFGDQIPLEVLAYIGILLKHCADKFSDILRDSDLIASVSIFLSLINWTEEEPPIITIKPVAELLMVLHKTILSLHEFTESEIEQKEIFTTAFSDEDDQPLSLEKVLLYYLFEKYQTKSRDIIFLFFPERSADRNTALDQLESFKNESYRSMERFYYQLQRNYLAKTEKEKLLPLLPSQPVVAPQVVVTIPGATQLTEEEMQILGKYTKQYEELLAFKEKRMKKIHEICEEIRLLVNQAREINQVQELERLLESINTKIEQISRAGQELSERYAQISSEFSSNRDFLDANNPLERKFKTCEEKSRENVLYFESVSMRIFRWRDQIENKLKYLRVNQEMLSLKTEIQGLLSVQPINYSLLEPKYSSVAQNISLYYPLLLNSKTTDEGIKKKFQKLLLEWSEISNYDVSFISQIIKALLMQFSIQPRGKIENFFHDIFDDFWLNSIPPEKKVELVQQLIKSLNQPAESASLSSARIGITITNDFLLFLIRYETPEILAEVFVDLYQEELKPFDENLLDQFLLNPDINYLDKIKFLIKIGDLVFTGEPKYDQLFSIYALLQSKLQVCEEDEHFQSVRDYLEQVIRLISTEPRVGLSVLSERHAQFKNTIYLMEYQFIDTIFELKVCPPSFFDQLNESREKLHRKLEERLDEPEMLTRYQEYLAKIYLVLLHNSDSRSKYLKQAVEFFFLIFNEQKGDLTRLNETIKQFILVLKPFLTEVEINQLQYLKLLYSLPGHVEFDISYLPNSFSLSVPGISLVKTAQRIGWQKNKVIEDLQTSLQLRLETIDNIREFLINLNRFYLFNIMVGKSGNRITFIDFKAPIINNETLLATINVQFLSCLAFIKGELNRLRARNIYLEVKETLSSTERTELEQNKANIKLLQSYLATNIILKNLYYFDLAQLNFANRFIGRFVRQDQIEQLKTERQKLNAKKKILETQKKDTSQIEPQILDITIQIGFLKDILEGEITLRPESIEAENLTKLLQEKLQIQDLFQGCILEGDSPTTELNLDILAEYFKNERTFLPEFIERLGEENVLSYLKRLYAHLLAKRTLESSITYASAEDIESLVKDKPLSVKIHLFQNIIFEMQSRDGLLARSALIKRRTLDGRDVDQIEMLRKNLDAITGNKTVTINAPTGAGKTFVSRLATRIADFSQITSGSFLVFHLAPSPSADHGWYSITDIMADGAGKLIARMKDAKKPFHFFGTPQEFLIALTILETAEIIDKVVVYADEFDYVEPAAIDSSDTGRLAETYPPNFFTILKEKGVLKLVKMSATTSLEEIETKIAHLEAKIESDLFSEEKKAHYRERLAELRVQKDAISRSIAEESTRIRDVVESYSNSEELSTRIWQEEQAKLVAKSQQSEGQEEVTALQKNKQAYQVVLLEFPDLDSQIENLAFIQSFFANKGPCSVLIKGKDGYIYEYYTEQQPSGNYQFTPRIISIEREDPNSLQGLTVKHPLVFCIYRADSVGGDYGPYSKELADSQYLVYQKPHRFNAVYQHLKRKRRTDLQEVSLRPTIFVFQNHAEFLEQSEVLESAMAKDLERDRVDLKTVQKRQQYVQQVLSFLRTDSLDSEKRVYEELQTRFTLHLKQRDQYIIDIRKFFKTILSSTKEGDQEAKSKLDARIKAVYPDRIIDNLTDDEILFLAYDLMVSRDFFAEENLKKFMTSFMDLSLIRLELVFKLINRFDYRKFEKGSEKLNSIILFIEKIITVLVEQHERDHDIHMDSLATVFSQRIDEIMKKVEMKLLSQSFVEGTVDLSVILDAINEIIRADYKISADSSSQPLSKKQSFLEKFSAFCNADISSGIISSFRSRFEGTNSILDDLFSYFKDEFSKDEISDFLCELMKNTTLSDAENEQRLKKYRKAISSTNIINSAGGSRPVSEVSKVLLLFQAENTDQAETNLKKLKLKIVEEQRKEEQDFLASVFSTYLLDLYFDLTEAKKTELQTRLSSHETSTQELARIQHKIRLYQGRLEQIRTRSSSVAHLRPPAIPLSEREGAELIGSSPIPVVRRRSDTPELIVASPNVGEASIPAVQESVGGRSGLVPPLPLGKMPFLSSSQVFSPRLELPVSSDRSGEKFMPVPGSRTPRTPTEDHLPPHSARTPAGRSARKTPLKPPVKPGPPIISGRVVKLEDQIFYKNEYLKYLESFQEYYLLRKFEGEIPSLGIIHSLIKLNPAVDLDQEITRKLAEINTEIERRQQLPT